MKVIEIAYTGYAVTNLKRARQFYEGTLGLTPSMVSGDENKAWVEYDIGPGTLAITNWFEEWKPTPGGGVAALEVEDFDAAMEKLRADGTNIINGPMETLICHTATISDPDGNTLIIHKRKA